MEALPPQLWQVCVGTLRSGIQFEEHRIPCCTICWSTPPTVFALCSQPVFIKTTNFRKVVR